MVIDKVLVDGLAAAEAFVHAVPEGNAALAKLPAQVDLRAPEQGWEIDQADIQILHQAARFQHRVNPVAKSRSGVVEARHIPAAAARPRPEQFVLCFSYGEGELFSSSGV